MRPSDRATPSSFIVNGKLMNIATECNETSGMIGIQSEGTEIEVRKIYAEPLKD